MWHHRSRIARLIVRVLPAWLILAGGGCNSSKQDEPAKKAAEAKAPTVTVDKPKREALRLNVGQPGQIQAFEHTPIYPKIAGYVLKWHVDIGDDVKANQ